MQQKAALEELLQYIRILILDDDKDVGLSIKFRLEQTGYPNVEFTASTVAAWEKLPYTNILLIDQYLNDSQENGIEFLRRAKSAYGANIDIILYSGHVDEFMQDAIKAGATTCLEKPLKYEYLVPWIRETARRIWYEKILNAIPDQLMVIDPSDKEFGKLHFINETKKRRFEGDKPLEYDYCWKRFERQGDGDRPCFECLALEAKSEKRTVRQYRKSKTWDGVEESSDVHAAPIFDQIGVVRGIIETRRDRKLKDVIDRNMHRIETENRLPERLALFLNGFTELGFSRVRFYQKQQRKNKQVYQGILQVGMPSDFDIRQFVFDASTDVPTQIITSTAYPTLFLVKDHGEYKWKPVSSTRHVYKVSRQYVPFNDILHRDRWIEIPLKVDGDIIAKVSVDPDDPDNFISDYELSLLSDYADWAGQALMNAQQRDMLRMKDETNQLIIQINRKISKMPIHNRWVSMAIKRVSQVLDASGCSLFLLRGKGQNARLVKTASFVQDIHDKRVRKMNLAEEYKIGENFVGGVYNTGRSRRVNNLAYIAKHQHKPRTLKINLPAYQYYCERVGEDIQNAMFVVLRAGNEKWGVLRAINKRHADIFGNRSFTPDDLRVFQALAGQIAVGFETDRLIKQIKSSQAYKEFIAQEYSHTLKNIMQPVLTVSKLLQTNPDDKELWELLENEIRKMKTTLNTMLQLVQLESTKVKLHKTMVNVRAMLEEAMKPYHILADDRNMEIHLHVQEEMPDVYIDRQLIYDAIANLLDNAIKYGFKNTPIHVDARCEYQNLYISVTDVGTKIAKEDRVKIFDKFFLRRQNVDKFRQLGLGLTYVKVVTEAHDGKVYVDPSFNKGAKIVMSIPLQDNTEEEHDEENFDR